ncbi:carotenoid cleavage dioxygenase [Striga asiatica]|uniref:Carotenoid cleavage dioxygenase n=1 Tax=Striga asiatica TaxID=4170 RepID=A0A5A7P1Q6_STRAF|nr:carotenoid cleavage dioxygenase [Striga asiatica]
MYLTKRMGTLSIPCSNFTPKSKILNSSHMKMKTKNHHHHHHHQAFIIQLSSIFQFTTTLIEPMKKHNLKKPTLLDTLDDYISKFLDRQISPSIDPTLVLSENNAPVDELPPTPCPTVIGGPLPPCLDGLYIRTGPNPQFFPTSPYYVFDGDGMLHSTRISAGGATFCSRYVRTHKHGVELRAGRPIIPNFFGLCRSRLPAAAAHLSVLAARVLTGQFDPENHGFGPANTNVALLGGRLFAMCESDLPYEVGVTEDGDVKTLGRCNFGNKVDKQFRNMTAHPKVDRETGDVFAYGYDFKRPFLTFYRIEGGLKKRKGVPIGSARGCTIAHDFALTGSRAVLAETQIAVNPWWVLGGRPPVRVVLGKAPRLGIIEKCAEDDRDMVWVDSPGFNPLHFANAWEEEEEGGRGTLVEMVATNITRVEHFLDDIARAGLMLEKVTVDVETGRVTRRALSTRFLDLAVVNPAYGSKKNRYVYAGEIGSKAVVGVVKLDLSLMADEGCIDCTVASRQYGPGCYGSEPFFVARELDNPAAEEDDGYLVTYMHDENIKESKFLVMDAKSPTLDIVAAVRLPQRVPNGFHGVFVPENDLRKRRADWPSCSGSEPFFVPREPDNPADDEDDSYLITYIHDEATKESEFLVMDAKSHTLKITAAVKLPGRVPTGFHGLFVRESDLKRLKIRPTTSKLLSDFFTSLDDLICRHVDPPTLPPNIDPNLVLSGNFSPVPELPPTPCHVAEGSLPRALDGAYIRNGPNPQFPPHGPHHLFDGDGMLHCVRISGGRATLASRFVRTYKHEVERSVGSPVVVNYFSAYTSLAATLARYAVAAGRLVSGQYDLRRGTGNANTSVSRFGGGLFALGESDLPYRVSVTDEGDVVTIGREEKYGKPLESMTAHPKVDPESGEVFAFRHNIRRPFLTYFTIGADGEKRGPEVGVWTKRDASLVHDFAVTENYAVFPDTQIVIRPEEIVRGGQPVVVDRGKVPRLGFVPRRAVEEGDEGGVWWVEVPGFNMMHAVNAWEEESGGGGGGTVVVMVAPNMLGVENLMEGLNLVHLSMERVEIDVRTKMVRRRPISTRNLEFAAINPACVGKKTRYMYAGIASQSSGLKMTGIVKLDLSLSTLDSGECVIGIRLYGPGCYSGEPSFVPKEPDNPTADEDDGYLVTFVHDETVDESRFLVMDAKSANLDIVAVVKLPQRVPYGFHGTFVRERDLEKFLHSLIPSSSSSSLSKTITNPKKTLSRQPKIITAKSTCTNNKIIIKHPNNPPKTLLAGVLNALDDLVCTHLDPKPLPPSIDPARVLTGHSAPVNELPPTPCHIITYGPLPPSLNGVYLRNGPNPQFVIPGRPHHFFEGDGMIHALKISRAGRRASFCCRYIKTRKHEYERRARYPFVPGVLSSFNGSATASVARLALAMARVASGQFDPAGHGTSNVSLALLGGRLLALAESDLPYEIRVKEDGDVVTLGQGFAYSYDVNRPFLTYFRTDSFGRKGKGVPINSVGDCCVAVHDFGVTESYAVFPVGKMVVRVAEVWRGSSPLGVDGGGGKVEKVGIIGRYAEDDVGMTWVEAPGLNMMHCVNAWEEEEGRRVVVVGTSAAEVGMFVEDFRRAGLRMERITIDVAGGRVVGREVLSPENMDLGVINAAYASRKNRYVYAAITDETSWKGIVKLDLSINGDDCTVARRLYGPGCNGGEPFFVPREPNNPNADEDDGYLITYMHDELVRESTFLVMDAKSPTLDIIAAIKLPQRVPDGFHGLFVPESELKKL